MVNEKEMCLMGVFLQDDWGKGVEGWNERKSDQVILRLTACQTDKIRVRKGWLIEWAPTYHRQLARRLGESTRLIRAFDSRLHNMKLFCYSHQSHEDFWSAMMTLLRFRPCEAEVKMMSNGVEERTMMNNISYFCRSRLRKKATKFDLFCLLSTKPVLHKTRRNRHPTSASASRAGCSSYCSCLLHL